MSGESNAYVAEYSAKLRQVLSTQAGRPGDGPNRKSSLLLSAISSECLVRRKWPVIYSNREAEYVQNRGDCLTSM